MHACTLTQIFFCACPRVCNRSFLSAFVCDFKRDLSRCPIAQEQASRRNDNQLLQSEGRRAGFVLHTSRLALLCTVWNTLRFGSNGFVISGLTSLDLSKNSLASLGKIRLNMARVGFTMFSLLRLGYWGHCLRPRSTPVRTKNISSSISLILVTPFSFITFSPFTCVRVLDARHLNDKDEERDRKKEGGKGGKIKTKAEGTE